MKVVYSSDRPDLNSYFYRRSIFLAGPTLAGRGQSMGSTPWRAEAVRYMRDVLKFDGTVFVPEPQLGSFWPPSQIRIEQQWLSSATTVMFWIPRSLSLPGFTTNIEWGWCKAVRPESVVVGFPADTEKTGYIAYDADLLSIPYFDNLADTCECAVRLCRAVSGEMEREQ